MNFRLAVHRVSRFILEFQAFSFGSRLFSSPSAGKFSSFCTKSFSKKNKRADKRENLCTWAWEKWEMKRLYASVVEDVHSSVKARASRDGQKLTEWVQKAILDKLDPPGAGKTARPDILSGLTAERRATALRCIRLLEACPSEFADHMDAAVKSIAALERRVCRRK